MRKFLLCFLLIMSTAGFCFAQTNVTVDLSDEVYELLNNAEMRGLCPSLPTTKPYTEQFIMKTLDQISSNLDEKKDSLSAFVYNSEKESIEYFKKRFERKNGMDWTKLKFRVETDTDFPFSFEFNDSLDAGFSGGFYDKSSCNATSYEVWNNFNFTGDIGKNLSYSIRAFLGLIDVPLTVMGDYYIGNWWMHNGSAKDNSRAKEDKIGKSEPGSGGPNEASDWAEYWWNKPRTVKALKNYAHLPYNFKKNWDGSVYYLTNVSASGLEGWPVEPSLGFGMYGDLRGSWLNDRLTIGFSRINREWAAMDNGSSLVLNSSASPFLGIDIEFKPFDWLSISTVTGAMEFPNQGYMNSDAWYLITDAGRPGYPGQGHAPAGNTDSLFFQNLYSMAKVAAGFKYVYADFGSTVIYPKRFELGYMYPLIDNVVYQNSLGDYDNLGLFGDLKLSYPGIGSVWFSAYLDEINKLNAKFWENTRCMYAWQVGAKAVLPWLPFTNISFRYTKVEPYCYTHNATVYQPYSNYYISTAYMNNGYCLGYYLDPNSDEFFLRADTKILPELDVGFQYQLIRHGATWGSGQVEGSSMYSELTLQGRENKRKYFLKDGTYEWSNIIALDCSYRFKKLPVPLQLNCGIAYVYDWFTGVDNNGQKNDSYHAIDTSEYPTTNGLVVNLGLRVFGK